VKFYHTPLHSYKKKWLQRTLESPMSCRLQKAKVIVKTAKTKHDKT